MEARAIKKYIPGSPRKMRLVADQIRGKSVEQALDILHYSPKHASKVCETTLRSAVANLINAKDGGRINPEQVFITAVTVDGGPVMKRMLPAPQGRAYRVRKRSNHLTIVVTEKE
ncbi:MAG: 50S ribosomal protein L22 [Bacteroidetes bacterium]|nr:50S ribosomal protein L22 [Bacteroidota bacterium]